MATSRSKKGIQCKLWRCYVQLYFRIMLRDPTVERHSLINVMVYSHNTYQDETLPIHYTVEIILPIS